MTTIDHTSPPQRFPAGPKPLLSGEHSRSELVTIRVFRLAPFLALLSVVVLVWGWG
jgi:stearoyl-CoA desaturase (delta-9 desaturase)